LKNKQFPFWLFTFSVFTVLVLPTLLQDGMFLDGLLNSSIARNLAKGEGGFWALQYSKTINNPFYDQLPLVFGLQSLFFKLFGDHLYVERIYCLLTALITGYFIIKTWKHLFRENNELAALGWLPLLFWIITPVVFWSYSNNMLENTMVIFDIAAIYLIIKALDTNKKILLSLAIAGVLILAAFLSKGPVGLFPLVTVFIYWLFFKKPTFSKTTLYTIIVFLIPVLILLLLFLIEHNAFDTISKYFSQQIVKSVEGRRELAPNRFYIIERLISELVPIIALLLILFVITQIKRVKITSNSTERKFIFFYFAIALSGSLPILISVKQSGYYLVPSLPFYAIATGILAAPRLNVLMQKIKSESRTFKIITYITIFLFCGTLVFSFMQTGKIGRDKEMLKDVYAIGKIVPNNSSVSICYEMIYNWGLRAYLIRYFCINLDEKQQHEFYIRDKSCKSEMTKDYIKLEINTSIYEIYKRK